MRFGRAFAVGLGIASFAGLVYVAGWETYLAKTDGNFMGHYVAGALNEMRARRASAAEILAAESQMARYVEMYRVPPIRMLITFSEIFPVGLLVALVRRATLRDPRVLPARIG